MFLSCSEVHAGSGRARSQCVCDLSLAFSVWRNDKRGPESVPRLRLQHGQDYHITDRIPLPYKVTSFIREMETDLNRHEGALWNRPIIRFETRGINWLNLWLFEHDLWSNLLLLTERDISGGGGISPHSQHPFTEYVRNSIVLSKDTSRNQIKWGEMGKVKELEMPPYLCFSSSLCDDLKGQRDKGHRWASRQRVPRRTLWKQL